MADKSASVNQKLASAGVGMPGSGTNKGAGSRGGPGSGSGGNSNNVSNGETVLVSQGQDQTSKTLQRKLTGIDRFSNVEMQMGSNLDSGQSALQGDLANCVALGMATNFKINGRESLKKELELVDQTD